MKMMMLAVGLALALGARAETFVDAGNTRVRVTDSGGDGPVLVLLHGVASSLETWDGWESELGGAYRIVRLDLPGSGLTPRPNPDKPAIDDDLKVVRAVLAARGIRRYSVAGNSRGAWLAWLLAAETPDEVEKLIMISPIGLGPRPAPPDRAPAIARFVFRHLLLRPFTAYAVRSAYGTTPPRPETIDRYWTLGRRDGNRDAVDARTQPANFRDHVPELAAIKAPTLIVWGKEDHWLDPRDACRFHNAIAGSQLVVLPKLGHLSMEENPKLTAGIASQFLRGEALVLPDGARRDCDRIRPSRLLAKGMKHAEENVSAEEMKKRRKSLFPDERVVFKVGDAGPPVILLHELPGITQYTFQLADEIAAKGYTVYMPVLSGEPGTHREGPLYTVRLALSPFLQGIRRHHTSPEAEYIVRLAEKIHAKHSGKMGVIGMCMTGIMPLATLRHDFVNAVVLAQPSMPFLSRRDLGLSKSDVGIATERLKKTPAFALRFSHDDISHWERQEELEKLGIEFLVLDSSPENRSGFSDHAHATLTYERLAHGKHDATDCAFKKMLAYLDTQLLGGTHDDPDKSRTCRDADRHRHSGGLAVDAVVAPKASSSAIAHR